MQLQPIWNTIGATTRQLVEDLITLRKLLVHLTRYDCISFYTHLETIRVSEGRFGVPKSNWMLTDEAGSIFHVRNAKMSSFYPLTARKSQSLWY